MTIPVAFLDELRVRTSLSTLIGRTTKLTKAGREWKACCPFHQEKTPSFTVSDEKGFYHCFGCSAHGDCIRWMTDQLGFSFMDAVKELAALAGMEVPALDPKAAERAQHRDASVVIIARAQKWFAEQLQSADDAKAYLDSRGIRPLSIERFGIGYAPRINVDPARLANALFPDVSGADLAKLGLIKCNPDTMEPRDFFRRRLMIPIHDARGNVIAFGGRIIGAGEPKYLNSPDTPIFDKGRTLFNLHRVAAAARAKNRLMIVEGYMDVIGVDSVGFDVAVAPNGTALTEVQLEIAWRLVDVPVVCFDGDSAGRKAAVRAAKRAIAAMQPGKSLRFAFPPDGKDPDDLAREGGLEAVNALLEQAVTIGDVLWRDLVDRFDMRDPDRRAAMSAEIKGLLESIRAPDVRASYGLLFREMFAAASGRLPAKARRRPQQQGSVANAVEDAIALAILRHVDQFDAWCESVEGLPWRRDETKRLMGVLSNAFFDARADGDALDAEFAAAAIEHAGLHDFVAFLRRQTSLRMPFVDETDPLAARRLINEALRENFTR
jgi:DNA primase